MKYFWKNFLKSIPFSVGTILSFIGITLAIECGSGNENAFFGAILAGTIGMSLIYASVINLIKKDKKD